MAQIMMAPLRSRSIELNAAYRGKSPRRIGSQTRPAEPLRASHMNGELAGRIRASTPLWEVSTAEISSACIGCPRGNVLSQVPSGLRGPFGALGWPSRLTGALKLAPRSSERIHQLIPTAGRPGTALW